MKFIYLLNLFDWIGENIINGIAGFFFHILLWLDSAIYSFISYIYNIFLLLAGGGSIFNNNQVSELVSRIYTIIGVVVLFLAAYSLLKSMVNPDEALKGKKSPINIIKDVVISIVLIAFIPTIFDFAFEFQNSLLVENTIGKIIAGSPTNSSENAETIRMGGYNMAAGVLQAFIYVNPDGDENGTPYCRTQEEEGKLALIPEGKTCTPLYVNGSNNYTYGDLWQSAHDNTTFTNLTALAPLISEGKVNYIFLLDAVAGVFVLFVLLQYCLDMALRLVKLAVYELIAPLPILARIMPNEQAGKVFTNWTKATLSTFVEVFIRIAILYFAVILISSVGDSLLTLFGSGALNFNNDEALFLTKSIAHALIIIGIILFIKQAPEIIKEITGLDGGKYNVFKSAMQGFNTVRAIPKVAAQSVTNTSWDPKHKLKSAFNKFKNPIRDVGKATLDNYGKDYKGIGDLNKNYESLVNDTLADRRRKEAARKAKQQVKDTTTFMERRKEDLHEYVFGSMDTKALEEKSKVVKAAGSAKGDLVDLISKESNIARNWDQQFKAASEKAVTADEYFVRDEATGQYYDGYHMENIMDADGNIIGQRKVFDGVARSANEAQLKAVEKHGQLVKDLKTKRDTAVYEALNAVLNGTSTDVERTFGVGADEVDLKSGLVKNQISVSAAKITDGKAKYSELSGLQDLTDMSRLSSAADIKKVLGDNDNITKQVDSQIQKEITEARNRESLRAQQKGEK